MKKFSNIILFFAALWLAVPSYAGDTIANYSCDFEDEVQNLTWKFPVNSDVPHHWTIGEAVNNGGKRSLYVTPNGMDTAAYVNRSSVVYAYTDIILRRSSDKYILSFDWMGAGDVFSKMDGLYVFWLPDKDDLGDSIYVADQANNIIPSTLMAYALPLNPTMECVDSLSGKSTWQAWISQKTSSTDSRIAGGRHRRLVFAWRNGTGGPVNPGACIDNIAIVDGRACGAPSNLSITTVGEDSLVLDWQGEANEYEVGCYSYEKNIWQVVRVDTAHYIYTDVPEGYTDFYVRSICSDSIMQNEYYSAKAQASDFIYYPGNHCIDYITISDDNCYISSVKTNYVTDDYKYVHQMVDEGGDSKESRHTQHYSKIETDVRTGGRLHTVPKGEIASTRLGNWNNGGESERVDFKFHVDAEQNPILVMKYAVVLESPGHDKNKPRTAKDLQDPRFTLDVLHQGRSIGPCAAADYTSSWVSEGWNDTTVFTPDGKKNVVWKDWTTVGVNLEDYDGKDLIIRLTTYDCSMTAHFGYAYFTLGCAKKQLDGMNCDGTPSTDFSAPAGFAYRWYLKDDPNKTVLATTQTYQIDSLDSRVYNVDVIFPEDSACFFTLEASSQPHYPVASFDYKHTPRNCRNYVTITNTSHVETVNLQHHDTISSPVDKVEWDYGGGEGSYIAPGHSGTIEFPAEGGVFPVTITAWTNNCYETKTIDVVIPAIGEQITDTTVYRCPSDEYYFEGRNADGSIVRRSEPYTELGVYLDTLRSYAGCDSIIRTTLDVLKPTYTGQNIVILEGDTFLFHNRPLVETGIYKDTTLSVHGCDSIIDSVDLYVHEYLIIDMPSYDSICNNAGEWVIPFRFAQGRSCDTYSLSWDEAESRLPSVDKEPLPTDRIFRFDIPTGIEPNYYHAHFVFHDSLRYLSPERIPDGKADVTLALLYPDSVITQRWNDVLGIRNSQYNGGGWEFSAYQWYKNGLPVEGETDSYLYQQGVDLETTAEYRVLLTRKSDGVRIFTCPVFPVRLTKDEDLPTLAPKNAPMRMNGKGRADWVTTLGNTVYSEHYDNSPITTPQISGMYVLILHTESGKRVQRMIIQ